MIQYRLVCAARRAGTEERTQHTRCIVFFLLSSSFALCRHVSIVQYHLDCRRMSTLVARISTGNPQPVTVLSLGILGKKPVSCEFPQTVWALQSPVGVSGPFPWNTSTASLVGCIMTDKESKRGELKGPLTRPHSKYWLFITIYLQRNLLWAHSNSRFGLRWCGCKGTLSIPTSHFVEECGPRLSRSVQKCMKNMYSIPNYIPVLARECEMSAACVDTCTLCIAVTYCTPFRSCIGSGAR